MNIKTPTLETKNHAQVLEPKRLLKSAMLIVLLTTIFGSLSYGFIQLNVSVMKLSVPESLWCGLAMSLAVVYYLFQRRGTGSQDNQ